MRPTKSPARLGRYAKNRRSTSLSSEKLSPIANKALPEPIETKLSTYDADSRRLNEARWNSCDWHGVRHSRHAKPAKADDMEMCDWEQPGMGLQQSR